MTDKFNQDDYKAALAMLYATPVMDDRDFRGTFNSVLPTIRDALSRPQMVEVDINSFKMETPEVKEVYDIPRFYQDEVYAICRVVSTDVHNSFLDDLKAKGYKFVKES